jgi:aryl-alcohol dehydrogenase-like predicted oxidoreductase
MQTVMLGKEGPVVSRVCFGCFSMGGPGHRGWGDVDDNESTAAVHRALERGVTFFDNAILYGRGHAEEVLGRALEGHRHEVILATKGGTYRNDIWEVDHHRDNSPATLKRHCEESLRRLRTDYVDLYQIHWPDASISLELAMEGLLALVQEGKARYVGVTNYSQEQLRASLQVGPLTSLQVKFNMLTRGAEAEIIPFCRAQGLGLMSHSTLASGLLAGRYTETTTFGEGDWRSRYAPFGPDFEHNLKIVEELKPIAADCGRSLTQLATAWALTKVDVVIIGMKRPDQVDGGAVDAVDWQLTPEVLERIETTLARAREAA